MSGNKEHIEAHVISIICDDGEYIPSIITTQRDIIDLIKIEDKNSRLVVEPFSGLVSLHSCRWIKGSDERTIPLLNKIHDMIKEY